MAGESISGHMSKSCLLKATFFMVLPVIVEQAQPRALSTVLKKRHYGTCNRGEIFHLFLPSQQEEIVRISSEMAQEKVCIMFIPL